MRGLLKFVMVSTVAAAGAFVVTTVLADEGVRAKVRDAVDAVAVAVKEVKNVAVDAAAQARQDAHMTPVERNQAWVDEQWDALGI